jgi:hypothetical protein
MRQTMGTISNHKSYYNNTVHRYTTCDKPWEQSVTTGAVITTLYAQSCYNSSCGNIVPMGCRMLCSDAQCCYNSSCGYRLFPCFVACCVAMHSVVITHTTSHGNIVTTGAVIATLCITTQHATKHGNNQ